MHGISLETSLVMAFFLGALHILEPAHGRSIIHAMIVGSSGKKSDVLRFGASVIVSHLAIALLLAVIAWYAGSAIGEGVITPIFKIIGASVTLAIGILMLTCGIGQHTTCMHKHHGVEHHHDEEHEKLHAAHMLQAHLTNPTVLGVTGGLIPCQGTIALIALSIGTGSLQQATWLLISFAIGLGLCLIAIGLLTTIAAQKAVVLSSRLGKSRFLALAPGVVITLLGAVALVYSAMEFSALSHAGHSH